LFLCFVFFFFLFFFFLVTAPPEIYTLSLHDALPISEHEAIVMQGDFSIESGAVAAERLLGRRQPPTAIFCFNDEMAMGALQTARDRKSTRLNSSHLVISYAVFCLKKKKKKKTNTKKKKKKKIIKKSIIRFITKILQS